MQKCYNVVITGKVQDIGFRALIEDIARILDLKGYAFNDPDGSVKMVCCGENSLISEFFEMLRNKGAQKGVIIEDIGTEEIPFHIFLPEKFMRSYTDELIDISRKLDVGVGTLKDIKKDTSVLPEIKLVLESFVIGQSEHNKRLEKILEKLGEK